MYNNVNRDRFEEAVIFFTKATKGKSFAFFLKKPPETLCFVIICNNHSPALEFTVLFELSQKKTKNKQTVV